MQDFNTPNQAASASVSRRAFLSIAATGAAATLPVAALVEAGQSAASPRRPENVLDENVFKKVQGEDRFETVSDEDGLQRQLDICVEQLRSVLQQMHPSVEKVHVHVGSREDGSYRVIFQGDVAFAEYDGEGVYEISIDGYISTFWLEKDCEVYRSTGAPIPGMDFYWSAPWEKGVTGEEMRKMIAPRIVRKLPEVLL